MTVTSFCTRFVGLFFATSALLVVSSCGGGGGGSSAPVSPTPTPAQLTSINLSQDTLTLDRWGDSVTISAQAVDQNGNNVSGATITWSSPDTDIASVDNSGEVRSWLAGDVDLTVEASMGGITVSETAAVTVAVQQNPNCQVPTEFPVKGPVAPPSLWDVRRVPTQFVPDGVGLDLSVGRQITLDVDRDGDPDLLSMTSGPEGQGVGIPIETVHRVWLNDGSGFFTDGTDAILGQNSIPWSAPRNMDYADFDADGFEDVVVFQQGWEFAGCGTEPGDCPGGPNLLFLPQPGGLIDSAPTRLNPYDLNEFTHSGAIGDVDCDGDVDIFEANWGDETAGPVHNLQFNSGAGTFEENNSLLPDLLLSHGISSSALCDLDRDGDPDLITSLPGSAIAQFRISVNDGFGRFRMLDIGVLPTISYADQALCGDLDLDGYDDIVMGTAEGSVAIRNLGDMSFEDVTSSWLPADPTSLTSNGLGIIDLNDDGWPELMPETDEAIYWNTGNGVFTKSPLPAVCCGSFTTVADFDMNGRPDIYLYGSNRIELTNTLYLNQASPAPIKLVFATSQRYSANLGGFAGADAICQQHAGDAGLPGNYAAFLSGSDTDAINRIPHGEFHRVGDNAVVARSKLELTNLTLDNPVGNDENGIVIIADVGVWTGSDHDSSKLLRPGVGYCSDWSRDTDEDPGRAAAGRASETGPQWVRTDEPWSNCSELHRLYCFQQ